MSINYRDLDSWAYWQAPANADEISSIEALQQAFHQAYVPGFPAGIDTAAMAAKLPEVKYVFIGLNPGNAGPIPELFGNFHGKANSGDYRLATITYGTAAWGAFMTDLVPIRESKSSAVTIEEASAQNLLSHLAELGIPESATLIALGKAVYKALDGHIPATRHLEQLMHYSLVNGHWNAATESTKLQAIIAKSN